MFTWNNYTDAVEECLQNEGRFTYLVYGREICPTTGTPHLQGYCEFEQTEFATVQGILSGAHFRARHHSQAACIRYCKKDGDVFEGGSRRKQGERVDLTAIQDLLDTGVTCQQISVDHFSRWCIYRRSFEAYATALREADAKAVPKVFWIYGGTGVGKTRSVYDNFPIESIWRAPGQGWFDGYVGQAVALFDDFGGEEEIKLARFLQLLDRYPITVPVKCSFTCFNPRVIVITSQCLPEELYSYASARDLLALRRRITHVIAM